MPIRPKVTTGLAAVLVATTMSTTAGTTGADAVESCSVVRTYGFTTVSNDPPWASVVGHVQMYEVSQGSQHYQLTITDRMFTQLETALIGGCTPQLQFQTRATTGALGHGSADYSGSVQVLPGGAAAGVTESGSHPLAECQVVTCQVNETHLQDLNVTLSSGDVIEVIGTGSATAIAGGISTIDQAHADWRVRHPVLRIPIP